MVGGAGAGADQLDGDVELRGECVDRLTELGSRGGGLALQHGQPAPARHRQREDREPEEEQREEQRRAETVLRPEPVRRSRGKDRKEFEITREDRAGEPLYHVRGVKPERWVQQTDFNNDEAVGYLADRFAKLGIEDELFRIGARPGDKVSW